MRHRLKREAFQTSRLLEFCSRKELVNQTGHAVELWPLVILKELVDNAIDAAEEAGTAPVISVNVTGGKIVVEDNGPGIPVSVVQDILDFSTRTSSREAYVSPTRGAQGNALKTIVAMPYALDDTKPGEIIIEARSVAHRITFHTDLVRQAPTITHVRESSPVKIGTRVTVGWPDLACSKLADAERRFLQIAEDHTWLNPHLDLTVIWDGKQRVSARASDPGWAKWRPSDPTSAHWYDPARLERLMAAYIARDQDRGRDPRTVRDFASEFRGLSGSANQKLVLDEVGAARLTLPEFFGDDRVAKARIAKLLAAMQKNTRPVKPKDLGSIGKAHLAARFEAAGVVPESFEYSRTLSSTDGLPQVVESAFGFCPNGNAERRQVVGVNWSPGIINPFRSLGGPYGKSLDSILTEQRAGDRCEPIIFVLHLAHPRVEYSDRGKSSVVVDGSDDDEIAGDDDE
jgi:DNA topoisomerase VI subunit B